MGSKCDVDKNKSDGMTRLAAGLEERNGNEWMEDEKPAPTERRVEKIESSRCLQRGTKGDLTGRVVGRETGCISCKVLISD